MQNLWRPLWRHLFLKSRSLLDFCQFSSVHQGQPQLWRKQSIGNASLGDNAQLKFQHRIEWGADWKEPGPFMVPVKLWRVRLETILPDIRMGPNRTRASVAIDINARLYSVAIMYPLWLPHSHNMTDFCAFLTYFYHLSHTAVTVIIQTGSFRVLNVPHI